MCDAQPELLRVARNFGRRAGDGCPVCDEQSLVHVSFAFGPRLPPSGRALSSQSELRDLASSRNDVYFYVVEVCTECCWNHLLRSYSSTAARRAGRA